MSYSLDFRKRVMETKEKEGLTFAATSQRFRVNIRSLFRWNKRLEPKTTRNKPATKINMEALQKDVIKRPEDYQWERAQRFNVSVSCIKYALRRLGLSYKKNSKTSQGLRAGTYQLP